MSYLVIVHSNKRKTWQDWAKVPKGEAHESLIMSQAMIDAGFTPRNNSYSTLPIEVPQVTPPYKSIMFVKGTVCVWPSIHGWQVAESVDGSFTNYRGCVFSTDIPFKKDRFPESNGYIPDLRTVIELDKKGEL